MSIVVQLHCIYTSDNVLGHLNVLFSVRWQWTKPSTSVDKPTEVWCVLCDVLLTYM